MALCSHHSGSVYISCSDNIRCRFGSHLCAWLRIEEVTITNDNAFHAGTLTALARKDAIKKSNIVIIIISEEYPSSKHCLDELEMILKYGEKKEILPVFYHIRSEDIEYQTGSFKNAFIELGSKFPEQMVKIWRNSFKKVVERTAYKVNINRDESEIVQNITKDVCSMMKCVCSLDAQGLIDATLRPTTTHRTLSMPVSVDLSKRKQLADGKDATLRPTTTHRTLSMPVSVDLSKKKQIADGKDATLRPTTTHRTLSMPVSVDLSKKKQIADGKDATLRPTTTHRTLSMPVSVGLSKKKQIADGKVKLRPQVGSQSEELLEKLVCEKLPSKKIHRPELHRGKVTEEQLINMQKMGSCDRPTASTSYSFSVVNHDVGQQTLAKDSVPSQSCLTKIRMALKTISDGFSRGSSVLQDFECLKTLKASLSYLSDLGPEEGISNERKVAIGLITDKFKLTQELFKIAEHTLDRASKLNAEKERASYDCQQYRCHIRELAAGKKFLDEMETQLEGKQVALRNQLSDVQTILQQNQAIGVGLVEEMQSCYDAAKVQEEVINKCCKELKKLQPSVEEARKSKADVEATMEKFKNQACLESLLAEIEKQLHGSNGKFHLP